MWRETDLVVLRGVPEGGAGLSRLFVEVIEDQGDIL